MQERGQAVEIEIILQPHGGIRGRCSQCRRPAPGYDRLPERRWQFVPLWGIATWFRYAPRRVQCPEHGVVVEYLPWSDGKRPLTCALMGFLARWARRLSWRETARVFQTSWESVYRSVEWFVEWGLAERQLAGVESMGVDEIHWGHGLRAANFLTVIYQIDGHCRRLLWVGQRRTEATLRRGLKALGPEVVKGLRFVCSDMWKPYLQRAGGRSRAGAACAGSFPHHHAFEPGGGPSAAGGECASARGEPGRRAATQAHALDAVAAGQPRPGKSPAEAPGAAGQQAADGPGLGVEGNLRAFLEIPLGDLGGSLSRLLDLAGHAQPSGTDEESRPHAAVA